MLKISFNIQCSQMKDEVGIVSTTQVVPGDYQMENIKSKLILIVSIIWLFRKSTSKKVNEMCYMLYSKQKHYVCNNNTFYYLCESISALLERKQRLQCPIYNGTLEIWSSMNKISIFLLI